MSGWRGFSVQPMMPGQGGPPGPGMAALMQHPAGGTGAATQPNPMQGQAQQAMTGVKLSVEALQKSLTGIPMGSDLHTAVLKAITEISKHLDKDGADGDQASVIQQLAQMARQQQTGGQAGAMNRMFPQGAGGQPQPPAMQ